MENFEDQATKLDTTTDNVDFVESIRDAFDSASINYALRIKQTTEDRVEILKRLKSYRSEYVKSELFEKLLALNPWLLNPDWNQSLTKLQNQTRLNSPYKCVGGSKHDYVDLLIYVSEKQLPVIVSLKRETPVDSISLNARYVKNQLSDYKKNYAREAKLDKSELSEIELFFICSAKSYEEIDIYDLDDITSSGITVLTYDMLIENALNAYNLILDNLSATYPSL